MSRELEELRARVAQLELEVTSVAAKNDHMLKHVQQIASGVVLTYVLEKILVLSGNADQASRELMDQYERIADKFSFDGIDPALSDLATQELRDALIRTVLRARGLAIDETLDPNAYRKDWRIER
jgi:hypothetical protein